ncbi:MAG: citrate synthase family protein [Anaerolineae bacterium]|nr:citrate synthase family protein [Anaerolineae bacterium]
MKKSPYLSAQEAADALGISISTLYAYVSRGMIRSEAGGDDPRARRYSTEDVERLKSRKESRRDPEIAAKSALHLGMPVLESAITLIENGHLYYRGRDAVQLAREASVEQVAALLWTAELDADTRGWFDTPHETSILADGLVDPLRGLTPFEQFQAVLPLVAVRDYAAYDLRPGPVAATGGRILNRMTTLTAGGDIHNGLAETLAGGWAVDTPEGARLVSAALILCADHELNVSAFTVRCVASAQATPYAAVIAGLAALGGAKHGGHTERVEAFLREAGTPEGVYETMAARLRRGEPIPGFGHMLYPDGDPRGRALLQWTAEACPNSPALAFAEAAAQAGKALLGDYPTIDLGLVILTRALKLPGGATLALFAMGRTIGWIGHAIEQYQTDRLIRPRARYTGERPVSE